MKLEDMPTPLCEPFKFKGPSADTSLEMFRLLKLTEQRLGFAVSALKKVNIRGEGYAAAQEALAQIEEGKL